MSDNDEFRTEMIGLLREIAQNTRKGTRKASPKADEVETPDFLTFWEAYPRKVGRGTACVAWNKLKPPLDKCLAGIAACKRTTQWQNGPIPHPTTWLNGKRWTDTPISKRPTKDPDKCCVCGGPATMQYGHKWYCSQPDCRDKMYGE